MYLHMQQSEHMLFKNKFGHGLMLVIELAWKIKG